MAANEKNEVLNPRQNNKTNRQKREEEKKQMTMLKWFGLVTCGLVVLLVVIGLIVGIINKPSRKTVATIGNEQIKLDEYQSAVRMQRANLNNNYQYMQQLYAMFGMQVDASTRESYAAQMSDAYKGILGQQVLSNMIDQRVMAYGAAQEGITVSDEEVNAYYQGMFGYYPEGTPTSAPTREPFEATPTVSEEQLAILRYTETPLPTEVPAEETEEGKETAEEEPAAEEVADTVEKAEEAVETAVEETVEEVKEAVETAEEEIGEVVSEVEEAVSETEEAVEETVEETVSEPTAEPTLAPTPTVYTEEMFKQYETYYFANNFNISKDFFKKQIRYDLLEQKVKDIIEAGVPRTADMVWARHILVATEEEAQAALDRINSGEEWGDVAAEVSTDSTASKGGDLGWFDESTMVKEFADAAFSQEVGTISNPVKSDFGYHLIQVIAHEEHPYTSSGYDNAVNIAYSKWLNGYADQLDISFETNIADKTPTDPAFVG